MNAMKLHRGIIFAALLFLSFALFAAPTAAEEGPGALYRQGMDAYERFSDGDVEQSIRLFKEVTDRFPRFAPAYAALAESLVQKYNRGEREDKTLLEGALENARQALMLDAKLPDAHKAIGSVFHASGKTGEAIEELERAVDMEPDYARAWLNLGTCHLEEGRKEKAEEFFMKAVSLGTDRLAEGIGHYNLATVRAEEKREEPALVHYGKAREKVPGYHGIHFGRGVALMNLGRDKEALADFAEALALKKDYREAWFGLAAANHRLGNKEEAEKAYLKLLELDPEHEEALMGLRALKGKKAGCFFLF